MSDEWRVLVRGGLPLSGDRDRPPPSSAELAAAVLVAIKGAPVGRPRDALCAFLAAWRDHFSMSFSKAFGADESRVLAWQRGNVDDPDRFLKLRRIALENLATVL